MPFPPSKKTPPRSRWGKNIATNGRHRPAIRRLELLVSPVRSENITTANWRNAHVVERHAPRRWLLRNPHPRAKAWRNSAKHRACRPRKIHTVHNAIRRSRGQHRLEPNRKPSHSPKPTACNSRRTRPETPRSQRSIKNISELNGCPDIFSQKNLGSGCGCSGLTIANWTSLLTMQFSNSTPVTPCDTRRLFKSSLIAYCRAFVISASGQQYASKCNATIIRRPFSSKKCVWSPNTAGLCGLRI